MKKIAIAVLMSACIAAPAIAAEAYIGLNAVKQEWTFPVSKNQRHFQSSVAIHSMNILPVNLPTLILETRIRMLQAQP